MREHESKSESVVAALVATHATSSYSNDVDVPRSSPPETKKRAPDFLGKQEMVQINVTGRETKHTFLVHKNFLCYHSPFFNAALNGKFLESDTQTITLDSVSPKVFNIFVTWTYSQKVEYFDGKEVEYTLLIPLWLLADRLMVPRLQNDCARTFMARKGKLPVSSFEHIYNITTVDSPLRRMLVDKMVAFLGSRAGKAYDYKKFPRAMLVDYDYKNIPREMLVEILEALRTRIPQDSELFKPIFRDDGAYLVSEGTVERRRPKARSTEDRFSTSDVEELIRDS